MRLLLIVIISALIIFGGFVLYKKYSVISPPIPVYKVTTKDTVKESVAKPNTKTKYVSEDRKISFEYPGDIFKYPFDRIMLFNDGSFMHGWESVEITDLNADLDPNYLKLWIGYFVHSYNSILFDYNLKAADGTVIDKNSFRVATKVKNISNDGINGYIYKEIYTGENPSFVYIAVWSAGSDATYDLNLVSPNEAALDKNYDMFLEVVNSVKFNK